MCTSHGALLQYSRVTSRPVIGSFFFFFPLGGEQMLTSTIRLLPSGCVLLYYMLPTQLFLQPQFVHHRAQTVESCQFPWPGRNLTQNTVSLKLHRNRCNSASNSGQQRCRDNFYRGTQYDRVRTSSVVVQQNRYKRVTRSAGRPV